MKLIVGLGNPGGKYKGTRHNVGFEVLGELARRNSPSVVRAKFDGEVVDASVGGERIVLLCPLTYMNRSGRSVRAAADFYKLEPTEILVVCDDFSLPLAKLRIRIKGSAGGQKGLKHIIQCLSTEEVPRLRIGIGQPPERWDPADFVLSKFGQEEKEEIEIALQRAAEAVETWVCDGIETCMNQFNAS